MYKFFDNGEGCIIIVGGQGIMWIMFLQMGELVDMVNCVYDFIEICVFIIYVLFVCEGIFNQFLVVFKVDFFILVGLYFCYGSLYNEFSVNLSLDYYCGKFVVFKVLFNDVWDIVRVEVEFVIQQNDVQQMLFKNVFSVVEKMFIMVVGGNFFGGVFVNVFGVGQVDESVFKNMWNFNLVDVVFGWFVLEIQDGRIGIEMCVQGFNFFYCGVKQQFGVQLVVVVIGYSFVNFFFVVFFQFVFLVVLVVLVVKFVVFLFVFVFIKFVILVLVFLVFLVFKEEKFVVVVFNGVFGELLVFCSFVENIIGLFIMNVQSEDQICDLFFEEDKVKIVRIEKWGQNKVVYFKMIEDCDDVLNCFLDDVKNCVFG